MLFAILGWPSDRLLWWDRDKSDGVTLSRRSSDSYDGDGQDNEPNKEQSAHETLEGHTRLSCALEMR